MSVSHPDSFGTRQKLAGPFGEVCLFSLPALGETLGIDLQRVPCSIRILLENLLRREDGGAVRSEDIRSLAGWSPDVLPEKGIRFLPARILLQDYTGVPAIVDLVAMRDALSRSGGDGRRIHPVLPVDLVVDHSVQVDRFASPDARRINEALEQERNAERYQLLRWAQQSFSGLRVVPPGVGICHQVNLEYLARVVAVRESQAGTEAFPDSCLGTDSHTPMVNALGVLGWGVGGIEAEAVMLGQPYEMPVPAVTGVRLEGCLREGVTPTDLVLTLTAALRRHGVVGRFVEYFGPGLKSLGVADRAVLANMAPEYGATVGFFPMDALTLEYLRQTGREESHVALVEAWCRAQGLFREEDAPEPVYTDVLELRLEDVEPSLAGPKRPQDRVALSGLRDSFRRALTLPVKEGGFGLRPEDESLRIPEHPPERTEEIGHGAVVLAAITSCTNTSNPALMLAAGLLARKARAAGLSSRPWVKTSLAPGSRVVMDYLDRAGLTPHLEALGFHLVGYGCTTCIGNSGPLPDPVAEAIRAHGLVAVSVLSGNRNFEGRIHPLCRANYLASPPLVVAFALAGRIDVDFSREPLGEDPTGQSIYLRDLWPSPEEIREAVESFLSPELFRTRYAHVGEGGEAWSALEVPGGTLFDWEESSTYIRRPPWFDGVTPERPTVKDLEGGRVLTLLGDSVTTDHISPAGSIHPDSVAAGYLAGLGVPPADFNSYGARRGNHEVMVRGTFANIRLKNLLVPGVEGGVTRHFPSGRIVPVYEAARLYAEGDVPLVILAGKEYGSGSSRDWAAKGTRLLGVRAVLAVSYERIHRSNLVGMGVLPLQFLEEQDASTLGLDGSELFHIRNLDRSVAPGGELEVEVVSENGRSRKVFPVLCRLDSPGEVDCWRQGGILPQFLRHTLAEA